MLEGAQELGQIRDDDVRSVLAECIGLAHAVDADDEAEASRAPGGHSCQRVLEHRRLRRLHAEQLRGGEKRVGCRLAAQMLPLGHEAVDAQLEEIVDARRGQHRAAVLARRHDGAPQSGVAHGVDVADGALVRLDAPVADDRERELVLAIGEIGDLAVGQPDTARFEKRARAVVTLLAVDVLVVVR